MNMKALRKSMDYLDLKKYKLIQTSLNSLVIFKSYHKEDCSFKAEISYIGFNL